MSRLVVPPEVTMLILDLLDRRSVVPCARVCKSWHLLAIRKIWKTAHWVDLIKTFVVGRLSPWQLASKPLKKDWDRLYLYCMQVQCLQLGKRSYKVPKLRWDPTSEGVATNPQHSAGGPLFPRVRMARYCIANEEDLQLGGALLQQFPQLSDLTIDVNQNGFSAQALNEFWSCLNNVNPKLAKLNISLPASANDASRDTFWSRLCLIGPVCQMHDALEYSSLISQTLQRDLPIGPETFSQLEDLQLSGSPSLPIFRNSWFPPRKLQFLKCYGIKKDAFYEIINTLSARGSQLIGLDLRAQEAIQLDRKISCLHCLQSLTILALQGAFRASDEDIKHLALGLPQLKDICLRDGVRAWNLEDFPCTITLSAIGHLVHHCPDIASIMMRFDAMNIPSPPIAPPSNHSSSAHSPLPAEPKILTIAPFGSPLQDGEGVAQWLGQCCSRYRWVRIRTTECEEYLDHSTFEARWWEVGACLDEVFDPPEEWYPWMNDISSLPFGWKRRQCPPIPGYS